MIPQYSSVGLSLPGHSLVNVMVGDGVGGGATPGGLLYQDWSTGIGCPLVEAPQDMGTPIVCYSLSR